MEQVQEWWTELVITEHLPTHRKTSSVKSEARFTTYHVYIMEYMYTSCYMKCLKF